MDDLDEPTYPPITVPVRKVDGAPVPPGRVADGTRTKLGAAPPPIPAAARAAGAKATLPPPIPGAAKSGRTAAKGTLPPPIPAAALAAKPRGTTSSMAPAPSDNVLVDPLIAPPLPSPSSTVSVSPDIDVPIDHEMAAPEPASLPPLPSPTQNWLATTAARPPVRLDEPRRRVTQAPPPIPLAVPPAPALLDSTPLPPPLAPDDDDADAAGDADHADPWAPRAAAMPSRVAPHIDHLFSPASAPIAAAHSMADDLFAPAPRPTQAAHSEADDLFAPAPPVAPPSGDSDIETSAVSNMFAMPAAEDPSTTYFERSTYNKRHLAAVGIAALALTGLVAVAVRAKLAKPKSATPVAQIAAMMSAPVPTPAVVDPAPAPAVVAPAPAVVAPAAPAVVAAAPASAIVSAAPQSPAATVDIPVTSTPSGATVTLIVNGTPKMLGHTPLFASVDPAQSYDLVVAMTGHPTAMQHVDPHSTKQVAVAFDAATPAPIVRTTVAQAPTPSSTTAPEAAAAAGTAEPVHHHHHTPRVAAADPAPAPAAAPAPAHPGSWNVAPAAKPVANEPTGAAASGILMVASKPPCEIVIDGTITHLETPQRSIALPAGSHAVTLINAKLHINKTIPIQVAAKQPTKLIQDFTH